MLFDSSGAGLLASHPAWQALAEAAGAARRPPTEAGQPLVGLSCSLLPTELPLALGLLPWRVRPVPGAAARAQSFLQGFACSYLQQLLHRGLGDELSPLGGLTLVVSHCDSMRSFPALWRASRASPAQLFSLSLPARLEGAAARELLEAELGRWLVWLEELAGRHLEPERLVEAAQLENRVRDSLRQLRARARSGRLPYALVDLAARGSEALPRRRALELLASAVQETEGKLTLVAAGAPRLALLGGSLEVGPLLAWIEAHGGGVVDDDTCTLGRTLEESCDLDPKQPFADLAARLLRRPPCPSAPASAERRLRTLHSRIVDAEVQGVLLVRHRGCEGHGFDAVLLGRRLEQMGVPHLELELEPGAEIAGRAATRLETFLEMLSGLPE